jgi:hypothetical protein
MLGDIEIDIRKDNTHVYIKIKNSYLSMIFKNEIKIDKAFARKHIAEAMEWLS